MLHGWCWMCGLHTEHLLWEGGPALSHAAGWCGRNRLHAECMPCALWEVWSLYGIVLDLWHRKHESCPELC